MKDAFEGENIQTQCSVLHYKIDLYFHEYKLAIEVDGLGHENRNIDYEIQRQKAIEKELDEDEERKFPDEENFNVFKAINEIDSNIKKLSKKSLIGNISKKLIELQFNSNRSIITKVLKRVGKKVLP